MADSTYVGIVLQIIRGSEGAISFLHVRHGALPLSVEIVAKLNNSLQQYHYADWKQKQDLTSVFNTPLNIAI